MRKRQWNENEKRSCSEQVFTFLCCAPKDASVILAWPSMFTLNNTTFHPVHLTPFSRLPAVHFHSISTATSPLPLFPSSPKKPSLLNLLRIIVLQAHAHAQIHSTNRYSVAPGSQHSRFHKPNRSLDTSSGSAIIVSWGVYYTCMIMMKSWYLRVCLNWGCPPSSGNRGRACKGLRS